MSTRYKQLGVKRVIGGETVIDGLSLVEVDYKGQEVYHQVQPGEVSRLDLISYSYFGTPEYWWIIALYNQLHDPLFGFRAGDVLKIPVSADALMASVYKVST